MLWSILVPVNCTTMGSTGKVAEQAEHEHEAFNPRPKLRITITAKTKVTTSSVVAITAAIY
jgi:hypothetical protein